MEIKVTDLSSSQKKRYTLNLFYWCWWRFLPLLEKQMFLKEKDMVSCKWAMAEMY
jgi:hypothetical protein